MRKIISMILAMAMVVTTFGAMTAFAAVADTTAGDFPYSAYEIYNDDLNGYAAGETIYDKEDTNKSFQGLDIDTKNEAGELVNPSRFQYIQRATGDTALKLTVDPSVEFKSSPYLGVSGGGTTAPDGTAGTYTVSKFPDAKALVMEYDIMFPELPTGSIQLMQRLGYTDATHTNTTLQRSAYIKNDGYFYTQTNTKTAQEIVANTWYKLTTVTDFSERVINYYVDGTYVGADDISNYASITQGGYYRIINLQNAPSGLCLDNFHYYWSTDVEPEDTSNPYKYSVSGPALDFEDYTVDTSVKDSTGTAITQLTKTAGVQKADSTWSIIADPTDATNDVLMIDATNSTGDIYWNFSSLSGYSMKDKENNAIVLSMDIYVDDASKLGSSGTSLLMGKILIDSTANFVYVYATKYSDDVVGIKLGSNVKTFPEKEWHNVQYAYTPSNSTGTLYVDNQPVGSATVGSGTFTNLDYWRTQIGSANKPIIYFDNYHLYEGTTIPAGITATGYTAGTSEVGDSVTLTAASYVTGQTATIEKSTDGTTWTDLGTASTSVTLTTDSVYYRAKVGTAYSEPVILYGVGSSIPEAGTGTDDTIWDIDFEPVTVDGVTTEYIQSTTTGTTQWGNLRTTTDGGATSTQVKNSKNGVFNINDRRYSSNSTETAESGTTLLVAPPADYATSGQNVGTKSIAITGNNVAGKAATHDLYVTYGTRTSGTAITSFDFAVDDLSKLNATSGRMIAGLRYQNSTAYYNLFVKPTGMLTMNNIDTGVSVQAQKWYTVTIVGTIGAETNVLQTYLDGELINEQTGLTMVQLESFRVYGDRAAAADTATVYYDNFDIYMAAAAPTVSDIKLSTIAYDNNGSAVDTMGAYSALNATATVTNNGVAGNAVVIFARYTNGGKKLADVAIKPISLTDGQTSISVKGELGASAAGDTVKVFIWDGLGSLVPGVVTANNAEL